MEAKPQLDSELESFRRQWRTELQSKKPESTSQASQSQSTVPSSSKTPAPRHEAKTSISQRHQIDDDEEYVKAKSFDAPGGSIDPVHNLIHPEVAQKDELVTALDHYEAAVDKEAIGSLGDSLRLYRRAFHMDHRVDLAYRKKHHAAQWHKPPAPKQQPGSSKSKEPDTIPVVAKPPAEPQTQTMTELLSSFSGLSIASAPPPVEGDPAPPCPISELPQEILSHILQDVAVMDVGDFVRLSLVCKRFAYLVATESQLWRRVCTGSEFGFQGMHYHWQKDVLWDDLDEDEETEEGEFVTMEELARRRQDEALSTTLALLPDYSLSWMKMFRHRPRIRYNGCYISTCNYIRSGQAAVSSLTWGNPVHIVTYYRYLRFFRDGTVISLLTTSEPGDVVHHMTKDHLKAHRKGEAAHLPSVVMQHGLKGRWRLSSVLDNPDAQLKESEGELCIETEGVGEKYIYRMDLTLRSAGKGARNNKLAWKGFYSYNKLTDDWAEFGLNNDKPFFFSRVRSYGVQGA